MCLWLHCVPSNGAARTEKLLVSNRFLPVELLKLVAWEENRLDFLLDLLGRRSVQKRVVSER